MNKYGVIMAGGGGTRFWPLSRKEEPKQLLNLSGKEVMVNETIDRISHCIAMEDIFIVTNQVQAMKMKEVTKERLLENHILSEPDARNTTACIGYAAMEIVKKYGDGVMCVLPADHFIKDLPAYKKVMDAAIDLANQTDQLITIGIKPTYPAVGYGYIKTNKASKSRIEGHLESNYYIVEEFAEKPDVYRAKEYLNSGEYLWNSGMFVWKASVILKQIEDLLPDVYSILAQIGDSMNTKEEQATIENLYRTIPKISIDYGIMERAKNVLMMEAEFGWNDVGSLDMLALMKDADENGNVLYGEQINLDTKDCICYASNQLIATVGVSDLIIIQTKDAVFVCDKNRAQDVKLIVDELSARGKDAYL